MNSKYKLLNDESWLRQKYCTEKLSTKKIAALAGAKTPNSVRQALLCYGIPLRDISEGLTVSRDDSDFHLDLEALTGGLLGDASLRSYNPDSEISGAYFSRRNKYRKHVEFVAKAFYPKTGESRVKTIVETYAGTPYELFSFRTGTFRSLKTYFNDWYPLSSGRVKAVPRNIDLTPKTILHWFLDDGSSFQRRKNSSKIQVVNIFCSESFSKEDQEFLIEQLNSKYSLHAYLKKVNFGSGFRIEIGQSQAESFFRLIGSPPVEELAYKWKTIEKLKGKK